MKKPTIALVMIVKNGAATLARCLSSVQGHIDDVVVLDMVPRLLPRGVRYAGRIHEQPVND